MQADRLTLTLQSAADARRRRDMTLVRLIVSAIILLLAAYIAVMNWGCVVASLWNQKKGIDKHCSTVPVVTVLLAGIACPIYPYDSRLWAFAIPLADIANWFMLWLLVVVLRESREEERKTEQEDGEGR